MTPSWALRRDSFPSNMSSKFQCLPLTCCRRTRAKRILEYQRRQVVFFLVSTAAVMVPSWNSNDAHTNGAEVILLRRVWRQRQRRRRRRCAFLSNLLVHENHFSAIIIIYRFRTPETRNHTKAQKFQHGKYTLDTRHRSSISYSSLSLPLVPLLEHTSRFHCA